MRKFRKLNEARNLSYNEIYDKYVFIDDYDFNKHADKKQNGINQEFIDEYYNGDLEAWYKEEEKNTTNVHCFNCLNCDKCEDCWNCAYCERCAGCILCDNCIECYGVYDLVGQIGVYESNEFYNTEEKKLNESFVYESETASNKERKEELITYLKGLKYHDYVKTLNDMLDDPKAKTLLVDGFGGKLGDTKLNFETVDILVSNLVPTQSEIDVEKSLKFPLTNPKYIHDYYKNKGKGVIIKFPLITFRKNYIIDGHHRWSQVYALNPDATMTCCNYDGNISPIEMLKATQGSIAAVKAEDNKNNRKIPSQKVEGQNIFDDKWDEKEIKDYVAKTASDDVVDVLSEYIPEMQSMDDLEDFIASNLINLKVNNEPEPHSPNRGDMPQTDKGGTDENDDATSTPDSEGSALNKLKDDEFVKMAVKK